MVAMTLFPGSSEAANGSTVTWSFRLTTPSSIACKVTSRVISLVVLAIAVCSSSLIPNSFPSAVSSPKSGSPTKACSAVTVGLST